MLLTPSPLPSRSRGFTLIELMVSMTIGLIILLGMTIMFVNNTKSQTELEKSNRQTEAGRYASQLLSDDIYNAGYYAEFDPSDLPDVGLPGICDTSLATMRSALPLAVQGLDNSAAQAACLTDAKPDSDVLLVRRVETCVAGQGNCEAQAEGGALFQASLCNNSKELGHGDPMKHFSLEASPGLLSAHMRDCTELLPGTPALVRRFITHVYYVAKNHKPGDKIPTLMRATLTGKGAVEYTIEPMAEGIEVMHFEYGMDTNLDGAPDMFSPAPVASADWRNVVAVKMHLLSRNTQESISYNDTKVYVMGRTAAGDKNVLTIATADKHFKRHVFSKMVTIPNTAGRKSP